MTPVKAILFDWRGTLVALPSAARWVEQSLRRAGRNASPPEVDEVRAALRAAIGQPEIRAVWSRTDVSAAVHRSSYYAMFAAAGLDAELADSLYAEESDPANNEFAADAHRTLHTLHDAGVRTAIVSDIHFDLRPAFAAAGLAGCVDSYVLSFQHGVQKPDEEMFRIALRELAVTPAEALMVGDRATHDGAAVDVAIPTLLLPTLLDPTDERLRLVLSLCGLTASND